MYCSPFLKCSPNNTVGRKSKRAFKTIIIKFHHDFKLIENHENEWMLCLHEGGCKHQRELRPLDILRQVDLALFCNEVSI